jgi:hypothetical protein
MFGRSEEGVEKTCERMGLSADDGPGIESFAQIAGIQAAWSAVKIYQAAQDKAHAENKIMGVPSSMKVSEYTSMRMSFEKAHGKVPDKRLPGVTLLERLEAETEDGEFTAPHLNEIPSKEEVADANKNKTDSLGLAVTFTSTGAKLMQPLRVKLSMPTNTEQLRDRIRLLASAMEFLKIRFPTSKIFASSDKEVWNDHLEYILGDKVMGREVKDTDGTVTKVPSWQLVLGYEYAIRNKACVLMNEGNKGSGNKPFDVASALMFARECPELRQEEFIEKLQLQSSRGASSSGLQASGYENHSKLRAKATQKPFMEKRNNNKSRLNAKAKAKQVKGKGKGKGNGLPKNNLATSHEGKQICFAFNNKGCKGPCDRAHVCQICFGKHPLSQCSAKE